jgi:hypothetical protein
MTTISILLSTYGKFNLQNIPYNNIPINSSEIRYNKYVIDQFNLYGNYIAKNCTLVIDKIPRDIFNNKKIIIHNDYTGKETLYFYDLDGDVFMRNF